MSIYKGAFMNAVDYMSDAAADAAYEAAYGEYYTGYMQMQNASNRRVAAEANIAAIRQDKINTDRVIDMQKDDAEAQAKVMAALSGTTGQSVDAVEQQIRTNSAFAKQANAQRSEQEIEQQLAEVYNSYSSLVSSEPRVTKIDPMMAALQSMVGVVSNTGSRQAIGQDLSSMMGMFGGAG